MATPNTSDLQADVVAGRDNRPESRFGLLVVVVGLVVAAITIPRIIPESVHESGGLKLAATEAATTFLQRAGSVAGLCIIAGFLTGRVHRSVWRVYLTALIAAVPLVGGLGPTAGMCAAYVMICGVFIGRGMFQGTSSVFRRVAGAIGLNAAMLAGLAAMVVDHEPTVSVSAAHSNKRPRQFEELFQDDGRIEVSQRDLNLLLESWFASANQPVAGQISIVESEIVGIASFSFDAPWFGNRYVNITAACAPRMDAGHFDFNVTGLKVGRIQLPKPAAQSITQAVLRVLESRSEVNDVLTSIEDVRVSPGLVEVYGPSESSVEGLARAFGDKNHDRERILRYMVDLIANCSDLPETDERFCGLIERGFYTARESTRTGADPVEENRAAIISLAIQVGDPRVRHFVGFPAQEEIPRFRYPFEKRLTLLGRNDLARHFFVSAAMFAIAGRTVSDTAGLFKEQLDSVDGGSGFSFADLAADRAGVRFAKLALGSDESARNLQRDLAAGFTIEDLMPSIAELPEGLTEHEVQERYGGVTGSEFQQMLAEIDRRINDCRLLGRGQ